MAVKTSRETLDAQKSSGESVIARLEELKNEAEEVVGAVGTASTANWYRDHANDQQRSANTWRWNANGGFVAAFAVSIFWLIVLDDPDDSWRATLLKGTLSISLFAAATYAIRESSQHRQEEFKARSIELKIRALDPFIANLDGTERQNLKGDMARQIFILDGKHDLPKTVEEAPSEP